MQISLLLRSLWASLWGLTSPGPTTEKKSSEANFPPSASKSKLSIKPPSTPRGRARPIRKASGKPRFQKSTKTVKG